MRLRRRLSATSRTTSPAPQIWPVPLLGGASRFASGSGHRHPRWGVLTRSWLRSRSGASRRQKRARRRVRPPDYSSGAGVRQLFFKYCSTFDSTPDGNIGPITDALVELTGSSYVVHCPAYPANGRTVYRGHLFVGDALLSESPMRDHPLNPMRDSKLQRVLAAQTRHRVDLLALPSVQGGVAAVRSTLDAASRADGVTHVVADAVCDDDLETLAVAVASSPIVAGAAAFGAAFGEAARAGSVRHQKKRSTRAQPAPGPTAILAGSLSTATRSQVAAFDGPILRIDVDDLVAGDRAVGRALDFATGEVAKGPVLIATDDSFDAHGPSCEMDGAERARRIELTMGRIGRGLVDGGVRRLIVAGGETSGAVADALELSNVRIGPDISVGVPWIVAEDRGLAVVFKSGNFGGPAFFTDAIEAAES